VKAGSQSEGWKQNRKPGFGSAQPPKTENQTLDVSPVIGHRSSIKDYSQQTIQKKSDPFLNIMIIFAKEN
jgi:hypothetical protein